MPSYGIRTCTVSQHRKTQAQAQLPSVVRSGGTAEHRSSAAKHESAAMRPSELLGLKRADDGGQPDAGPPHYPMGLGCGGYLTRPYGCREGQQPSQLIHSWGPPRELRCFAMPLLGSIASGRTTPHCSYHDGRSVAISVSAASTWLTTMLVQMSR